MTTDARALIEEGKRHDEAMVDQPWRVSQVDTGGSAQVRCDDSPRSPPSGCLIPFFVLHHTDAAGIAWMRNNLAALLTGYSAALDEVERLTAESELRGNTVADLAHELGTVKAVRDQIRDMADLLADLCGGVIGADDDDRIGTIKAHFSNRPSMWLRDAMRGAVDAYRARKAGT